MPNGQHQTNTACSTKTHIEQNTTALRTEQIYDGIKLAFRMLIFILKSIFRIHAKT